MKLIGIALVILGIVALAFGLLGFGQEKTILEMGGVKATATEHRTSPIASIVGALSLIGGIALIVVDKRRA